jgi:undecaprenyl-diphosphatase
MTAPLMEVALAGAVDGLTESLPLSGAAHRALARMLLSVEPDATRGQLTALGVWTAAAMFFRKGVLATSFEAARGVLYPTLLRETRAGRDAITVALCTVAASIIGLALRGHVAAWGGDPMLLGGGLLVSALALGSTLWAPAGDRDVPTAWGAVMVGAAEGAATLPGLSRTAVTLAALMWLGVRAPRALELCFLVWLPFGLVSLALGATHLAGPLDGALLALVGALLGALAGLYALRAAVARQLLPAFSLYLVPLAFATMAWGYARP